MEVPVLLGGESLGTDGAGMAAFGEGEETPVPADDVDAGLVFAAFDGVRGKGAELVVEHGMDGDLFDALQGVDVAGSGGGFAVVEAVASEEGISAEEVLELYFVDILLAGGYAVESC